MIGPILQNSEVESFRMANTLLKDPVQSTSKVSFDEVLETQAKEVAQKVKDKASDIAAPQVTSKKKKGRDSNELIDITKLTQGNETKRSREIDGTYKSFNKKGDNRFDEELSDKGQRQQALENATNVAYQPYVQPVYDQGGRRRYTKADVLANWERFTPYLTEDATKKSVRIDIPLLEDIQALVLRLHPDKSITASILGSGAIVELVRQNKDKLDRNLKHHNLSLREFNGYTSEVEFNTESGTRKKKKQDNSKKIKDLKI